MDEEKTFGAYIRRKRLEAGLTQKDLAVRLFLTESSVSKWERNLSYPDVSLVPAICRELHISEHEFFTACDDDQKHAQERTAAVRRAVGSALRRLCLAGYAIAVPVCLIVDWVVFRSLDWFWIVLAGMALAFCFTNLPWLIRRERISISLGAASVCLLLLLLACWHYAGGHWLMVGLAITAASLALPWSWWAAWRHYGKHAVPLCVALASGWVFLLLAVIRAFTGGDWLLRAGYPLAALGVVFLWACYGCLRWVPGGAWAKAGAVLVLAALAVPAFNGLCAFLLPEYHTGNIPWLNRLVFLATLAAGLVLLAVGGAQKMQKNRPE